MNDQFPLELNGYMLWPDGSISVRPEQLSTFLLKLPQLVKEGRLFVTEITPEIIEYNRQVDVQITVKDPSKLNCNFPPEWCLPEKYKYLLNLDEYLIGLAVRVKKDELYDQRLHRLSQEIALFKKLQLDDVLRTLIYVVEELERQGVVWGVGRGSSCSSYLLYLIGLHEVDPVRYGIEITDFLKETTDAQKR